MTTMEKLAKKLKKIYDNYDFVVGVLTNAETEENYKEMLEIIENDAEITPRELVIISVMMGEKI